MHRATAAALCSTSLLTGSAAAGIVDFESFDLGEQDFLDVDESLVFPAVAPGVDMTIVGGADLRVYDLLEWAGADPGGHGQAMIDFDWGGQQNPAGTEFLFSAPITGFSLVAGDYGGDDDGLLTITAYDASGGIVATDSVSWVGGANPPFALLSLAGEGITRVVYASGGDFTGSTFFDDVTVVPGPGGLGLLVLAAVGGGRRRRA